MLAIDARDVEKTFRAGIIRRRETVALAGVTLGVSRGAIFGLLGPNGAGKTTLLSILSCLLDADSGTIHLAGRPLASGDRAVRRRIGMVPQELAIYEGLTARENLHFFGELYGLTGSALRAIADEVLAAVGLSDRADQRAATFSGGMKRRLNLGAAIVHSPRLLLLDEPTTGVDPQSRNHIFEGVRRLNAAGLTVVYTSHYMEEVQALCPRIGIIDHGRLIACDMLPNLLRQLSGAVHPHDLHVTPLLLGREGDADRGGVVDTEEPVDVWIRGQDAAGHVHRPVTGQVGALGRDDLDARVGLERLVAAVHAVGDRRHG